MNDLTAIYYTAPNCNIIYTMGRKQTDKTKEKLRQAHLGTKHSEETKKKISKALIGNSWNIGRKASIETKKKMSNTRKGKPKSREWKEKIATAHRGKEREPFSLEWRKRISASLQGIDIKEWKEFKRSENHRIRNSKEYIKWRTAVYQRDNYTCVWCGVRSSKGKVVYLNADHIKTFSKHPELRFELDNGRTLCEPCHRSTNTFGRNL